MSRPDHLPHVKGCETSKAAADSMKASATTMRAKVLAYLQSCGGFGATDDELETVLGMRHQTASARRRDLVLAGLVEDSGERRNTRSGRIAKVWIATSRCKTCARGKVGKDRRYWCGRYEVDVHPDDRCRHWENIEEGK